MAAAINRGCGDSRGTVDAASSADSVPETVHQTAMWANINGDSDCGSRMLNADLRVITASAMSIFERERQLWVVLLRGDLASLGES